MTAVDRVNRTLLVLLGLLLLAAGGVGLALSYGAFGDSRANAPILPGGLSAFIARNAWFWWAVAAAAVIVGLLALRWLVAQLRTSRIPRMPVDRNPDGETILQSGALTDAIEDEAETYLGVNSARANVVDRHGEPTVDLALTLDERADIGDLRQRIASQTVPNIRRALDSESVPIDIQLRLAPRQRQLLR